MASGFVRLLNPFFKLSIFKVGTFLTPARLVFRSSKMLSTRLHELSEPALQNVLRYLSSKPSALSWLSFVAPEDALMAVHPSCALCDVARAGFTRLITKRPSLEEEPAVHLPNEQDPALLTRWFQSAGHSLEELILSDKIECANAEDLQPMFEAFEENCLVLRRLQLLNLSGIVLPSMLRATRGRLYELRVHGEDAPEIETCCTGLRKLQLHAKSKNILGILRVVGPTMESIDCTQLLTSEELRQVRDLCPKLTSISLKVKNDTAVGLSAFANLLCSYGSQLRFANLKSMSTALCEKILASCPNVRCDLDVVMPSTIFLAKLKVLGPHLKNLSLVLHGDLDDDGMEEWTSAMRVCSHLEKLKLVLWGIDVLSAVDCVFSHEMPLLTTLKLTLPPPSPDVGPRNGDATDVLLRLSAHVGTLREFHFSGFLQARGAFEAFCREACMLENVRINAYADHHGEISDFEVRVEAAVAEFLSCPDLRQMILTNGMESRGAIEGVSDLCFRVRDRKMHTPYVEVCGVEYLG